MKLSPNEMLEQNIQELFKQCKNANVDLEKSTLYVSGDGAVIVARFNSDTQDEHEPIRNVVEALINGCDDQDLYYAQKRINEEIKEMEEEYAQRKKRLGEND